jgi:regulator of RNase E activity RraB
LSDDWDFYFGRVNGAVSSIFVDLGIRPEVPVEKRPWLLWVFIPLQSPTAEGLSSNSEGARLHEIGEALDAHVSVACGAQLVGRITGAGRREFYFYGEEPGPLEEAVSQAMKDFSEYPQECGSSLEPDWDQYVDLLYPSDTNLQRMFNRRVLETLAERGDSHETPRQVDHWLEFPDDDARAACRDTLVAIEFKVESEFLSEEVEDEMPCTLVVSRVDSVDSHTINGITLELARLAQQHGGRYDGWESPVVGDPAQDEEAPTTH